MPDMDETTAAQANGQLNILEISQSGTIGTPDMGPVSKTVCTLANGFALLGHRVTVADAPRTQTRSMLRPDIDVVEVSGPRRGSRSWAQSARFLLRLSRLLRLRQFDVIHVHDTKLATLLGVFTARKCYYTSHTSSWALEREQGKRLSLGRRITASIESLAMRRARCTIALGGYLGRQVPDARCCVIANGVDPERWNTVPRDTARQALGFAPDDFVVQFVGRVYRQKGVDVLLEAVRLIAPELKRLRVVVIGSLSGDFHERDSISPFAAEMVRKAEGLPIQFTGFVANDSETFRNHMSACDVAVFPSRVEALGYVAIEALAMSVPVIASDTGGLAEVVTSDVGLLFPPENAARLAEALREVYENPDRLAALRANGRARVLNHYTTAQSIAKHLALFAADTRADGVSRRHTSEFLPGLIGARVASEAQAAPLASANSPATPAALPHFVSSQSAAGCQ
jgi:glycosyltransferase involved in cell wall biosynthesis